MSFIPLNRCSISTAEATIIDKVTEAIMGKILVKSILNGISNTFQHLKHFSLFSQVIRPLMRGRILNFSSGGTGILIRLMVKAHVTPTNSSEVVLSWCTSGKLSLPVLCLRRGRHSSLFWASSLSLLYLSSMHQDQHHLSWSSFCHLPLYSSLHCSS